MYVEDNINSILNKTTWCGTIITDSATPKVVCIVEGDLEYETKEKMYKYLNEISDDVTILSTFLNVIDGLRNGKDYFKRNGLKITKNFDYSLLTLLEDALIDTTEDYVEHKVKEVERDNYEELEILNNLWN